MNLSGEWRAAERYSLGDDAAIAEEEVVPVRRTFAWQGDWVRRSTASQGRVIITVGKLDCAVVIFIRYGLSGRIFIWHFFRVRNWGLSLVWRRLILFKPRFG